MAIEFSLLMLNLYVVIRAGPFWHHIVDMHSPFEYYDIYGWIVGNPTENKN